MHCHSKRPIRVSIAVLSYIVAAMMIPTAASAIPSFARQMELPCNGCHVQFPVLNSFGQQFKLLGYTMNARKTESTEDSESQKILSLPLPALLSVMFQADFTQTAKREPESKNNNINFPSQASLFLAGRVTPKIGSFVQVTYSGQDDKVGFDNTDIRYADETVIFSKPVVWGITANNNPTVTDPWNTSPAWGYPYASSESAPGPAANALVNGQLAQQTAGATMYALVNELLYVEAGVYGAAPLGISRPLTRDTLAGSISGAAPYWRVAVQHSSGDNAFMFGHFGLATRTDPGSGMTRNRFLDLGFDFQYRRHIGPGLAQLQARYVFERARWGTGNALNHNTTLHQISVDATYYWNQLMSVTLAPFATIGTTDKGLYGAAPLNGSRNGSPDSNGLRAQISFNPWINTRFTLQYTSYFKFNGRKDDYDGSGRDASDNNTLFLQSWLAW